MKKMWGLIFFIVFLNSLVLSQEDSRSKRFRNSDKGKTKLLGIIDSIQKNFLTTYADRTRGTFSIKTRNMEDLLYSGSWYPGTKYTSHAVIKIDNSIYSQNMEMSGYDIGEPNITYSPQTYPWDTNKIVNIWNNKSGVKITQELIPRENIQKKAGAVLIRYTFVNNTGMTKKIGMMLKLDIKIGGVGYNSVTDPYDPNLHYDPNDTARIASLAGIINTQKYISPVPDFWLAFENPTDTGGMIGRGTLRGKDLVLPDKAFIGDFNQLENYNYGYPLVEGGRYYDSEILLVWNEVDVPPGGTKFFSTLYGMGEIDYQGTDLRLYCKAPFDTLTLDQNSDYEIEPFDYVVTVANPKLTIDNVKAKIIFSNKNIFHLYSPPVQDPIFPIGTILGGDQKVAKWKISTYNQYVQREDTITVEVTADTIKEVCYTPLVVPANRALLKTSSYPANRGVTDPIQRECKINENVQIRATSTDPCWVFDRWTGPNDFVSYNSTETVSMNTSKDFIANFKQKTFNLTINISPVGKGSVSKTPDKTIYYCNEWVSLVPMPSSGYRFIGWSGDTVISTNTIDVKMWKDKNITANFEPDFFSWIVKINPANAGECIYNNKRYKNNDTVNLRNGDNVTFRAIVTDYCYKFKNWTTPVTGTDTIISFIATNTGVITANFEQKKFKLSILPFWNGKVTITPAPAADSLYLCGSSVNIKAEADKCYSFEKWVTNYGEFKIKDTTLQIYADITGYPVFTVDKVRLYISIYPPGSGYVNGKTVETIVYNCGDMVTLNPNPEPCYYFSKWSDGDTNISKKFTIEKDMSITALFEKKKFKLTAETDYPNSGTITRDLDLTLYDCGMKVNLDVNPNPCFSFVEWSGSISGTTKSIQVVIDTNKSIIAKMAKISLKLNSVTNNFPNIVLDFEVDSAYYNDPAPKKVQNITKSNISSIFDDGCTKDLNVKDYALYLQTNGAYKLVYALGGCFDQPCDTLRNVTLSLNRNGCGNSQSLDYIISLNSGCDSCSRLLRRKDTTKQLMMKLYPNHPNPFNPETKIRYSISSAEFVVLKVYDILGREIATLVNQILVPGEYESAFIPKNIPSGVYFYSLRAGAFTDLKKMLYMK